MSCVLGYASAPPTMRDNRVAVRCYGGLAELADADRDGMVRVPVGGPRPVVDLLQSVGVPHTEVDLVLAEGASVGWNDPVAAGQRLAAYPHFARLPAGVLSKVRPPPPPSPTRFVADVPLGDLAHLLQADGAEVLHDPDLDAEALVRMTVEQRRVLLTRDRDVLMPHQVEHGVLLRSRDPQEQLTEVLRRYPPGQG